MFTQATKNSIFQQGQRVIGVYCGKNFSGAIGDQTRPMPDYKNISFEVLLDFPIVVYDREENQHIFIETNSSNILYLNLSI